MKFAVEIDGKRLEMDILPVTVYAILLMIVYAILLMTFDGRS